MDRLSIIIPVYNSEKYLKECIDSIIKQNYVNKEIILVNDGSTDCSEKLCKEYSDKYPSIVKYVYQKNSGQIAARKRGVTLATGDWCIFVDADDWIIGDKDTFDYIINEAKKNNADAVLYDSKKVYTGGKEIIVRNAKKSIYQGIDLACEFIDDQNFYEYKMITSLCGALYKTNRIRTIILDCPDDIRMSEDVACVWVFMANANIVCSSGIVTYCYRIHEESFCRKHTKDLLNSERSFLAFLRENFNKIGIWEKVKKQVIWQMTRDMMLADYKLLYRYYQEELFPFGVNLSDNIAIYGCGDMGQEYLRVLSDDKRYRIVMIVDKERKGKIAGIDISTPKELLKRQREVDKIIILATHASMRKNIEIELISMGIDSGRIAKMDLSSIISDIEKVVE